MPIVGEAGYLLLKKKKKHSMKTYWGSGCIALRILNLALDGGEWSAARPGRFTLRESTPWYHLERRLSGL
jgi:hypothetical protein